MGSEDFCSQIPGLSLIFWFKKDECFVNAVSFFFLNNFEIQGKPVITQLCADFRLLYSCFATKSYCLQPNNIVRRQRGAKKQRSFLYK